MELKYPIFIGLGVLFAILYLVVYFLRKRKAKQYEEGIKIANIFYLEDDTYYKRKKRLYKLYKMLQVICVIATVISSCVLLARPQRVERITDERYCRDVLICLDISSSVDEVNKNLVHQLKDTVERLNGERVGIIIFNTSPVLVSPLTDDYEYVIEQLEGIEKGLASRNSDSIISNYNDDDFYWMEFIQEGTLVGADDRGSSLIGDGLASTAYNFSYDDKDRPRVVIFATDNELYGDAFFSLPEAAALCKEKDITVYGVGTKEMSNAQRDEMQGAVESTGGKFFLEGTSGTFKKIVTEIENKSAGLIKGNSYVREIDFPRKPFLALLISCFCLLFVSKCLRV